MDSVRMSARWRISGSFRLEVYRNRARSGSSDTRLTSWIRSPAAFRTGDCGFTIVDRCESWLWKTSNAWRRWLKRGLTEEGHQVFVAHDGLKGYEMARSAEFDVIVLDVMLPGLDGITVARRLREARNQTPVLMLTARDNAAGIIAGLDSGADDYLTKPFSF